MKKTSSVCRCRLCACEEDFNNFFNIFDENPELELEMKITKLLPVVVMPWDPMSHMVCQRCIEKLNSFNEFYDTSVKAEKFLRTLYPSASESETENCDPVTQANSSGPAINDASLKLPPKKRQGLSESTSRVQKDGPDSPEPDEIPQNIQTPDKNEGETNPKRTLNCFIVTQITEKDSFFTCRDCFRTFTTQSSALAHSCAGIENCRDVETIDLEDDAKKSLPPLKIRLFSMKSGLFVCYLCQKPFEDKEKLLEHLKEHFLKGNKESKNEKKGNKSKGKRKGRSRNGQEKDEDWQETYKKRTVKRRRKSNAGPQKRGKAKSGGESENLQNETCLKCRQDLNSSATALPEKETMESTTQYSNIKNEDSLVILNSPAEENMMITKTEIEYLSEKSFEEFKLEGLENNSEISEDVIETPKMLENDSRSDEVTVLEVVDHKASTTFSSCIFCDKIFATKGALIVHQNKHLQGYSKVKSENCEKRVTLPLEEDGFLCSICAMMLPNQKALLEHEQYHLLDLDGAGFQKKIRIALGHEFPDREVEQECQISKGRGIITITVTAGGEKKIPQIEFI